MNAALARLAGRGLGLYAKLLARSTRVHLFGEEYVARSLEDDRPVLFASWHGQTHSLFPLIRSRLASHQIVLIMVDDERATTLQSFADTVGIETFPVGMDDVSMAGARRLLRLRITGKSEWV